MPQGIAGVSGASKQFIRATVARATKAFYKQVPEENVSLNKGMPSTIAKLVLTILAPHARVIAEQIRLVNSAAEERRLNREMVEADYKYREIHGKRDIDDL